MDKLTLKEKIDLSEKLVDQYLLEISLSAGGVNAATQAVSVAQGLGHDAVRIADWFKRKNEDRKKQRELMAKNREEEKKRQQMA